MMDFTFYLQQKQYSKSTITKYVRNGDCFMEWLAKENLDVVTAGYNELMDYIRYLQDNEKSKGMISVRLCAARHYFNFLIAENKRGDNPAAGVFIKGRTRKLPSGILSSEEMELLFNQYSLQLHVEDYKKIMLGLMVFQGVTVGELARVRKKDIRLHEAKVFIKGAVRSNERLLNLHAQQLLSLKQYLDKNKFADKLFTAPGQHINNRIQYMFGQLRALNNKVTNAKQVRSSVITNWLKQYNLRQVQYMAGHKYVSSTERYQLRHIDDLKNAIQEHHPMK